MMVAIISEELTSELAGTSFGDGGLFNPVQDRHGRWCVSEVEASVLGLDADMEFEGVEVPPPFVETPHTNEP